MDDAGRGREGLAAGVVGGEGDVVGGVPVSRGDFESEREGEERVDGGGDGAALGDGEGAILVVFFC